MRIQSFEEIVAWKKGRELNRTLFEIFTENKNFSFKDQLFRASLSITNNIAEGFERGSDKELKYFLIVARSSTAEVRLMLYTALDIQYSNNVQFDQLLKQVQDIGKLLTGFIKKLSSPQQSDNKTVQQ